MDDIRIADHRLELAGNKLRKIHTSVVEMQDNMRNHTREFYYRLALLSGGVLSLDITFIGYLASKSATLHYAELLYLSWFFLILALIGALYRNHYNLDMGYYQTSITLNIAYIDEYQAKIDLLKLNPASFPSLKTPEEIKRDIEEAERNIKGLEKANKSMEKKEKMNSRSWVISQNFAHSGFVIGLLLTVVFASLNLPVKMDFTIWNYLNKLL
jgi:hypothetical protein